MMLVTSLSRVSGYDKASRIIHYALDINFNLREAALILGYADSEKFDRVVPDLIRAQN
jgi:fumarate hydratase, class II